FGFGAFCPRGSNNLLDSNSTASSRCGTHRRVHCSSLGIGSTPYERPIRFFDFAVEELPIHLVFCEASFAENANAGCFAIKTVRENQELVFSLLLKNVNQCVSQEAT